MFLWVMYTYNKNIIYIYMAFNENLISFEMYKVFQKKW